LLEIVVGHDARRGKVPDTGDLDARGVQRLVRVTGVRVGDFDDLAAGVGAARLAHKVRTFRLMALRTLNRGRQLQFPVCRPSAARLTARRLPL
jgi:hypothetical protein